MGELSMQLLDGTLPSLPDCRSAGNRDYPWWAGPALARLELRRFLASCSSEQLAALEGHFGWVAATNPRRVALGHDWLNVFEDVGQQKYEGRLDKAATGSMAAFSSASGVRDPGNWPTKYGWREASDRDIAEAMSEI